MPSFEFTTPDNHAFEVTAPDRATAISAFNSHYNSLKSAQPQPKFPLSIKQSAIGAAENIVPDVLGLPATIVNTATMPLREYAPQLGIPKLEPQPKVIRRYMESYFGPPKNAADAEARSLGGGAPTAAALVTSAPAAIDLLKGTKVASVLSKLIPGATARAQDVSALAQPKNMSVLGKEIKDRALTSVLKRLFDEQKGVLNKVDASMRNATQAERDKAFYDVYQQKRFQKIRDFERTHLGKTITQNIRHPYDVEAFVHTFPPKAFNSAQGVAELRTIFGNSQTATENAARDYAAVELRNVIEQSHRGWNWRKLVGLETDASDAALAAQKWYATQEKNGWLTEVPKVDEEIKAFIHNLESTGKIQRMARVATDLAGVGVPLGYTRRGWIDNVTGNE